VKLTDEAAKMISELVTDGSHASGAGLRIAQREEHAALGMSLAEAPAPDDVVVTTGSAAVFLSPIAEVRLEDETLDARHGELGAAFFLQP
jgi:Fe-S cluster assembly iron-binding protein IscA